MAYFMYYPNTLSLSFTDMQNIYLQAQINSFFGPKIYEQVNQSTFGYVPEVLPNSELQVEIPQRALQEDQQQQIEAASQRKRRKRGVGNPQKEIMSAKKNSQSNIINQFFSYFSSREKSVKNVTKAIKILNKDTQINPKILNLFYSFIRSINARRGRKYVNRAILMSSFTPSSLGECFPQIQEKILQLDYVNMAQICKIFRILCQKFIKCLSPSAILTSRRISTLSKEEHMKRRRRIMKTICGN